MFEHVPATGSGKCLNLFASSSFHGFFKHVVDIRKLLTHRVWLQDSSGEIALEDWDAGFQGDLSRLHAS